MKITTRDLDRVVPLFAEYQNQDDQALLSAIEQAGFEMPAAVKLLDLIPIAFFHAATYGKIAACPDYYVLMTADGQSIGRVYFEDEQIYVVARSYATTEACGTGFQSGRLHHIRYFRWFVRLLAGVIRLRK